MFRIWKLILPNALPRIYTVVICGLLITATALVALAGAYAMRKTFLAVEDEAIDTPRIVSVVPFESHDNFAESRAARGDEDLVTLETAGVSAPSVDPAWVGRIAADTGISQHAIEAYGNASLRAAEEYPGCGLGWNTLAAIGHVESLHGTISGSHLDDTGTATPAIIGPALDGQGFKAIGDTDGGVLDGDAIWDRAVGPMQFIPQTWDLYGRDGNGDGIADPQHIGDAALSAAVLLCSVGGDLTIDDNWIAAVNAYNQSIAYNHEIVDAADYYATFN